MKRELYEINLKYRHYEVTGNSFAAQNSAKAIELARKYAKKQYKWVALHEWDVIYLAKVGSTVVV